MKFIIRVILISVLFISSLSIKSYSQFDSIAVAILDSMSNTIGELETCSFRFAANYDIVNEYYGTIVHSESGEMFLKGPDKLMVEKKGDKGHVKVQYNGKTFSYYSFDKNHYSTIPAPETIIETIDSISDAYGVEFPAADVFYPDFVEELLDISNSMIFLGPTMIGRIECYHIAGVTDNFTYQFWIMTEKDSFLPMKMMIIYTNQPEKPRYDALYYEWKLNPEL
ncbi:MAG: DUF2092 domain-containing protein, partial [Ignavibacteria bacterium]|nr:DUF2092 domain-containing protein [Ignavibacteria bacterium]